MINGVSRDAPSLCIGDNETRYFIRINKKEKIDSTFNNIKNVIRIFSDTITHFYDLDVKLTESKRKICILEKWRVFGLIRTTLTVNIVFNEDLQVLGMWTLKSNSSDGKNRNRNVISKKIIKKFLKIYPLGEYLGKQELNCNTKAERIILFKTRENVFWEWFFSKGQHLLEIDRDKYYSFLFNAIQSVGGYVNCSIDEVEKVIIISGDQNRIERFKKYEPKELKWEIRYEIK